VHTARAERESVAEFIAEAIVAPSPVTRDSLPLCSPVVGESPGLRPGVASRPMTARREGTRDGSQDHADEPRWEQSHVRPGGAQEELTVEKMIWTLIGEPGSLTQDQRRGGQWKSAFPS